MDCTFIPLRLITRKKLATASRASRFSFALRTETGHERPFVWGVPLSLTIGGCVRAPASLASDPISVARLRKYQDSLFQSMMMSEEEGVNRKQG